MISTAWMRLAQAGNLSGQRLERLLSRFGDVGDVVRASAADLAAAGLTDSMAERLRDPDPEIAAATEAWLEHNDHHLVTWVDSHYPALLREISGAPAFLFVAGHLNTLELPQLAVVGSRNATGAGLDNAFRFAAYLAGAGFTITSGLARGIDGAAHRGALKGSGSTVAVCAHGLDQLYPPAHAELAGQIVLSGALVSEFAPGVPPRRTNFPRRNRIISGLSLGTLVVEAGQRSGALITARLASEQGREVFAIPGSIHSPLSRGCHRLIRDGATLVETGADIVEELRGLLEGISSTIEQNSGLPESDRADFMTDPQYRQLLHHMGYDPLSADQLVTRSGLTSAEVSSMLLRLELAGLIETLSDGRYQQREEGHPKQ